NQGEAATPLFDAGARRFWRWDRPGRPGPASSRARSLLLIGLEDGGARRHRNASGLGFRFLFAEALLGFLLGFALGFLVVAAAILLLALAGLGRFAFGALAIVPLGAP